MRRRGRPVGCLPVQIRAMKEGAARGEAQAVATLAHKIKGAAANVGGEALAGAASRLEQAAGAGDLAGLGGQVGDIESEFARLRQAMEPGAAVE